MAFMLAELVVQISTTGVPLIQRQVEALQGALGRIPTAAAAAGAGLASVGRARPGASAAPRAEDRGVVGGLEAGSSGAAGALAALNAQRRESTRLQRLARFLGDGEVATLTMLERVNARLLAGSSAVNRVFKEQTNVLVRHIATERGYGVVQTTLLRGLVNLHHGLGQMAARVRVVSDAFAPLTSVAGRGFTLLTGGLTALVGAGLRGTAEMGALTSRLTLLSRAAASVFYPVVVKVIEGVERLAMFFWNLTGAQQALARNFVLGAVGALAMVKGVGMLASGAEAALVGLQGLVASAISLSFPVAAAGAAVIALAAGLGAVALGTEGGRAALGVFWQTLKDLGAAFKPITDVILNFGQVVMTALGQGLLAIAQRVRDVALPLIERLKPVVARVAAALERAFTQGYSLLEDLGGVILDLVAPAVEGLFALLERGAEGSIPVIDGLTDGIHQLRVAFEFCRLLTLELADAISDSLKVAVAGLEGAWEGVKGAWQSFWDFAKAGIDKVSDAVKSLEDRVGKLADRLGVVGQFGKGFFEGLLPGVVGGMAGMNPDAFHDALGKGLGHLGDLWDKATKNVDGRGSGKVAVGIADKVPDQFQKAGGQFEGFEQTWKRFQSAVLQTDYNKQTSDNTKNTADLLGAVLAEMRKRSPEPLGMGYGP